MWAFWVSLYWSEFHRENEKLLTYSHLNPFFLSLFIILIRFFFFSSLSLFLSHVFFYLLNPSSSFSLSILSLFFLDLMKKMKGVASMMKPPPDVYVDQRSRFRHQSLLQDYEDLHRETEAMRRKLEAVKQKKLILADEVGFLRQRYQYLLKHPLPKPQPKQEVVKSQKLKIIEPKISKGRTYNRKESTLKPHTTSKLNPKERTFNGVEVTLQKTSHVFDLNQNGRSLSKKDASFHTSAAPGLDLNHKDRIHSGKEATKKSVTPFFDLNQISREEEELEGNNQPMWIEEQKMSTQRIVNEEQHNDIKLSVCRNIGEGTSRAGKRKITWQDQVALRV